MQLVDLVGPDRIAALTTLLIGSFARGSVVLLVGAAVAIVARGASAATRHLIWTLTLGGVLAAPALRAIVPHWRVPLLDWSMPGAPEPLDAVAVPVALSGATSNAVFALAPRIATADDPAAVSHGVGPSVRHTGSEAEGPSSAAPDPMSKSASAVTITPAPSGDAVVAAVAPALGFSAQAPTWSWTRAVPWFVALWALGAIVALVPTIVGLARLSSVARRARTMRGGRWALLVPSVMRELDVRRHVRFIELDGPVMPMTWGVFRPIVLLPAGDFDSTIEERLDVLRHELSHVRRYDCLTQLIAQIACALYWFNPLVWMAARELKVEREHACDDEVLRAGAKASDYADYLLRVAQSTRMVGAAALGGLAMARPSQVADRLLAVLDERRSRGRVSTFAAVEAASIAGLLVAAVASASPAQGSRRPGPLRGDERAIAPPAIAAPTLSAAPLAEPAGPNEAILARAGTASLAPVAAFAAPALPAQAVAPCDPKAHRDNSSHTNWTSSDNGAKTWRVMWSEGDCQYEISARGDVKYNRDVTDVESISSGGMFSLEQHIGDDTKRIVIRPREDGTLDRTYSVNGLRQEYDATAKAWFAEALVALDRQTAFAADQRVPAILERGGVDAVLQETTLLGSDYARRIYYTKLLSLRQLDRVQVKRVVEQAGRDMGSDYELAELLVAVSKLDAFSDESYPAFVAAAKKINGDYERRRALNALLQRDRLAPATVQALLEAASTINSDYELAELLIDVSKKYAINDATRPVYIKALGSIKSDYEHRRVLSAIVAGGGLTPAVNRTLLEDAKRIGSDYELAEFLIQIGKNGGLDPSTRDAYFAAADKIKSDYEHHRALTPLLTRDLLTKDLAKAILASAAKIDSDYECAQLLVEVANAIPIDDDLRPAFEKAADTIQGEYEYGRAMAAVRRRATR